MQIRYGFHSFPFGRFLIAAAPEGICHVSFTGGSGESLALRRLKKARPEALFKRQKNTSELLRLPIRAHGTPFQKRVWKALCAIPSGKVSSYGEVARKIGAPKAARAVGTACGKNPVGILIPCHRVVASNGKLGGYAWGLKLKSKILAWESAKH